MNIAWSRMLRFLVGIIIWLMVAAIFFYIPPSSKVLVELFCILIALGVGFLVWVIVPLRFALYSSLLVEYLLFLLTEHSLRIDLVLYGFAIIVLTEVFIGRRVPMIQ